MAILPLVIAPDPFLKIPSRKVEKVDDAIRQLLDDMLDTMYASRGVGLAAVQVGQHLKLVVMDTDWRDDDRGSRRPVRLVNPELVESSPEERIYNEGCLSFPDQYSEVVRPATVKVRYLDEQGNAQTLEAEGLAATCIQHEIDHTNGIVFVDHISRLKREMIHKKLTKMKKAGAFDGCGDHCGHDHH